MSKKPGPDNSAQAGCDLGRKENADDCSNSSSDGHQRHKATDLPDVARIAFDNPLIYNVRHQGW